MSQTGMPGPCYCIFLGPVFFTSPQWNFCALLQDEVFVTEWGDLLGLSDTESASVLGVTEVKPPKWMAHKQHVELQSMHISIGSDFPGAPVSYRGLQCRSLVCNPNAQLKIQLLGSTKKYVCGGLLAWLQLPDLAASVRLADCMPSWEQSELLAGSSAPFCTIGHGSLLAHWIWWHLSLLWTGQAWPCIPAGRAPALLTICHHMSHFWAVLFQAGWAIVRKVLVGTAFRVLVQLDPSFLAVSQHLM